MLTKQPRILIPTDFSENSKVALQYGISLASELKGEIILLHVIEPPYNFATSVDNILHKLKENANNLLNEWVKESARRKKVKIDTVLETGMTTSSILDLVQTRNIDLVVMGSKGETGFAKILFGSITADIMLHSPVPVLAIPVLKDEFEMDRILFATDLRKNDIDNLQKVIKLAELFNSQIDVLHIDKKGDFDSEIRFEGFRQMVKNSIHNSKITFNKYRNDNILTGINEYLSENPASLIVLSRYKKSVIGKFLGKEYTDKIGSYTNKPVLVLIA
ncbi:MAG: universal stress protein [Balneolaceae bacterium]